MYYATEAIPSLREFAKACAKQGKTLDHKTLNFIIQALRTAPKYLLPLHGQVGVHRINDDAFKYVRSPYPVTVFEFTTTSDVDPKAAREIDSIVGKPVSTVGGSSKRIIVVVEGMSKEWKTLTGLPFDGIAVIPIPYLDDVKQWIPSAIAAMIPRDNLVEESRMYGMKNQTFKSRSVPILPSITAEAFMHHGPNVINDMMRDVQEEVTVTIGALIAMNCRNVSHVSIAPSAKLNMKRSAMGREPFFEYKVLDIFLKGRELPSGGGKRAEAIKAQMQEETHMALTAVAGHFKTRKTGVFWWRDHFRGSPEHGIIVKDYKVKKQR